MKNLQVKAENAPSLSTSTAPEVNTLSADQSDIVLELVSHEHASDMGAQVEGLFLSCLFKDEELENGQPRDGIVPVVAEGITSTVGFHPERLADARPKVAGFISQMDEHFFKSNGGGWSFLNLCNDHNGRQWANLHRTMEQLVQLAIGLNLGGYCLPRELWSALPGGMPYVYFE